MDDPGKIHLHIEVKRSHLCAAAALALVGGLALALDSETLTMSTTYPAPSGVYQSMVVTGATTLARDAAGTSVVIGPGAGATVLDRAGNIAASQTITATLDMGAGRNVSAGGSVSAGSNVSAGGVVSAQGSVSSANDWVASFGNNVGLYAVDGPIVANGSYGNGYIWARGNSGGWGVFTPGNMWANDVWLNDVSRWASQGGFRSCNTYSYSSGGNPATFFCPAGKVLLSGGCDNSGSPVWGFHPVGTTGWYCFSPATPQTVTLLCCS